MSSETLHHINPSSPYTLPESFPVIQDPMVTEAVATVEPHLIAQELSEAYPVTPPEGLGKVRIMEDNIISLLRPPTAEEMRSSDEAWSWMFNAISSLGLKCLDDNGGVKNKLDAAGIEAVYPFGEYNKGQGESLRFKDAAGGEYSIHRGWTGESNISGAPETMSHVNISYSTDIPGPHGEKFEWGVIAHKQYSSQETTAYTLTDISQEGGAKIVRKGEEGFKEGSEEGQNRYVKLAAEAKRALEQQLQTVDPTLISSIDRQVDEGKRHAEQLEQIRQMKGSRLGKLFGRLRKN